MRSRRTILLHFAVFVMVSLLALAATAGDRIRIAPKFSPGEALLYTIESHTTTTGKTTAPISNPEGGSQSSQSIRLVIRLETLEISPSGKVQFRATYEKSSAQSESDALDFQASAFDDLYNRLEGRSFVFAIDPSGKIDDVRDVSGAQQPNQSAATPVLGWLQELASGDTFPRKGIATGEKWKSERPLDGAMLTGLIWRAESTYLRDEPCSSPAGARTQASADKSSFAPGNCAIVLTRSEILRHGSPHSDATPDDYLRNGLRTSGTWTGSGESLDSFSLATGMLVSSTQSSTQKMDYLVTSAATGSSIHRVGQIQTQSEITLVPDRP